MQVLQAFARAEKRLKPNWTEMFSEVYDELPSDLRSVRIDRFCSFCFMLIYYEGLRNLSPSVAVFWIAPNRIRSISMLIQIRIRIGNKTMPILMRILPQVLHMLEIEYLFNKKDRTLSHLGTHTVAKIWDFKIRCFSVWEIHLFRGELVNNFKTISHSYLVTFPGQAYISKLCCTYSMFVFQTTEGRDGETRENLQGQVSGAKLRVLVSNI